MLFRLHLIFKSLLGKWKRNLLSVLAIWTGMALVTALLYLFFSVKDRINQEMVSLGANIRLEPSEALFLKDIDSLPPARLLSEKAIEKLKTELFWRNNILHISPRLWIPLHWKKKDLKGLGLWINHPIPLSNETTYFTGANKMYEHWNIHGRWPQNPLECMVGSKIAKKYHITPGQRLFIQGIKKNQYFKVVGIHQSGGKEDEALIFNLSQAQKLSGLKGKVFSVDISAITTPEKKLAIKYRRNPESLTPEEYERWACTPYPGTVAVQIQKAVPNSVALVVRRVSQTQGKVLSQLQALISALALVGSILCSLSIMAVFILSLWEKKVEVALMEAIGATWEDIFFLFIVETSILGILGGFLGGFSGLVLGQWLLIKVFETSHFTLGPLFLAPLLGFFLALLGISYPLYRLSRMQPAFVLQEKEG
ncbi:MAG: FtsX-like permease family protein [Planctomycetota bacterium]|nr:MAG: FtsX-like permease family protein [Planctomycetota bacterium]